MTAVARTPSTHIEADSRNLNVALALAKAGLPVFPAEVVFNTAKGKWDKKPRIKNWQIEATTDDTKIRGWWRLWPDAVAGIELGRADLVVIDADRHAGKRVDGVANLAAQIKLHTVWPPHPTNTTPSDGEHDYFRQPPGEPLRNSVGLLSGTGIDVRGKGGWVVAPGSWRPDGKRWSPAGLSKAYAENTIPVLPDWLAALIRPPVQQTAAKESVEQANGHDPARPAWSAAEEARVRAALETIPSEPRDIWLRVGGALHWTGWSSARAMWDAWSQTTPGAFEEEDQDATWKSFARKRPSTGKIATLATIFHLAKENGFDIGGEAAPPDDGWEAPNEIPDSAANGLPGVQAAANLEGVQVDDFHAYMPSHSYIFAPTREMWPASSVNSQIPPIPGNDAKAKDIPASAWLDRNRPVEQMTWAPGLPMLIPDRLISEGGWIERKGLTCFNLYRPPTIKHGNATEADPWLDHIHKVFGDDDKHIIAWLAHRVQRPQDKINHALVLGGCPGIGKDTLLEPVKRAVGPWNFAEVSPQQILGRFNGFLKSVILRVNEARDLGDVNRYQFYDHMKAYTAAPPDVLRVDEKHMREHSVFNCCGVIITTNYKSDGIYLPADDRRHFVAWSPLKEQDFIDGYWNELWRWYGKGGDRHVAAYLAELDISSFDPKAPPAKTPAFWAIVDASRAPEDAELADVLDRLKIPNEENPEQMDMPTAVTLIQIAGAANGEFGEWIRDRKNRRAIPHRLEQCGYLPVRNDAAKDGLWKIGDRRQAVYAKSELSIRDQIKAARSLAPDLPLIEAQSVE